MVAVAIGVGVAGVASAGAGIAESNKAASTAKSTAAANNALETQIYGQNADNLDPYIKSGDAATTAINGLLYANGDTAASAAAYKNYQNSTGYQLALKTGQDAVTAALGQKGLTDSGAADKALTTFGQQFANSNIGTYIGELQGQQSTGLGAASALAGVGQNYVSGVSANNNTAANAVENADLSTANSISSGLNSLVTAAALGSSYGAGKSGYGSLPAGYDFTTGGVLGL